MVNYSFIKIVNGGQILLRIDAILCACDCCGFGTGNTFKAMLFTLLLDEIDEYATNNSDVSSCVAYYYGLSIKTLQPETCGITTHITKIT